MPRDPSLSDRAVTIRVPRHFGIASWRRRIAKVRNFAKMRYPRGWIELPRNSSWTADVIFDVASTALQRGNGKVAVPEKRPSRALP